MSAAQFKVSEKEKQQTAHNTAQMYKRAKFRRRKKKDGRPGTLYLGSERRATVADSSRGRLPVAVSVTAIAAAALRCSSHAAAKVDTRASVSSAETESSTASCAIE
jgi:hypothetical protein